MNEGPHPDVGRIPVRALASDEAEARLDELGDVLVDAVAHGASVNFLAGFSHAEATTFWRRLLPALASGDTQLYVACDGVRLLGTVLLFFAQQPNAPHRAEIGKMLVHSSVRRRGLGRKLLLAAEVGAREAGRTLLLLDTQTGSAGDRLYRACGWTEYGRVPSHALTPDGTLADTTMFLKDLRSPHSL